MLAMKHIDVWAEAPADKDFKHALSYLSLKYGHGRAESIVASLKQCDIEWFRADHLLRASGVDPLPPEDLKVRREGRRAMDGVDLPPVLVVTFGTRADISDGLHRISLMYWLEPTLGVPCLRTEYRSTRGSIRSALS